jgi:hypothetical protein
MKNYCFIMVLSFWMVSPARAQTFFARVVLLSGDTIEGKLLEDKLLSAQIRRQGLNRYDYIVFQTNDLKAEVYLPGSIKSYNVTSNEDGKTATIYYQSDSIWTNFNMVLKGTDTKRPIYLWSLVKQGPYRLLYFEQLDHGSINDRVFILENTATGGRNYIYNTSQLWKKLGQWPGCNPKDPRYKNWFTGKQYIVLDYNAYLLKQ